MKRVRVILAALMLATVGFFASPVAPAQAGPVWLECYTIIDQWGQPHIKCVPVGVWEEIDICRHCPWVIDFRDDIVFPETFEDSILTGIDQLAQAANAADPRTAARLHDAAIATFTSAAKSLKGQELSVGVVGYYDTERKAVVPAERGWLRAADQDFVDGITLLEKSLTSREPAALVAAATRELDQAFQELNTKRVMG